MTDEPFGRQPEPVTVTVAARNEHDARYWGSLFRARAEFKGDLADVQSNPDPATYIFKIYPRAVND